jgi:molybdate transport system substrate-binding protein
LRDVSTSWLTAITAATLLLFAALVPAHGAGGDAITVFAAASLTDVMQQIGRITKRRPANGVSFSFAGSMILAAPDRSQRRVDLFISADAKSMDYLDGKGLILRNSRINLLGNQLVLIAPAASQTALTVHADFRWRRPDGRTPLLLPMSIRFRQDATPNGADRARRMGQRKNRLGPRRGCARGS